MTSESGGRQGESERCAGCPAFPGEAHEVWCDDARCPECGEQREARCEHDDNEQPALWHGVDQRTEIARIKTWWTTAAGIDHLVEDYPRVLAAIASREIEWDSATQRYKQLE